MTQQNATHGQPPAPTSAQGQAAQSQCILKGRRWFDHGTMGQEWIMEEMRKAGAMANGVEK